MYLFNAPILANDTFTGVVGSVIAPYIFKIGKITDPVAQGVALGSSSHAVGTTKAIEIGEIQGACQFG